MNNLRISAKLAVAFAAMIGAFAVSSVVLFFSLKQIDEAADSSTRSLTLAAKIETIMANQIDQQNSLRAFAANPAETKQLTDMVETQALVDKGLDEFESTTQNAEQKARIQEMRKAIHEWRANVGEPILALAKNPATLEEARVRAGQPSFSAVRKAKAEISDAAAALVAQRAEERNSAQNIAYAALAIGGLASIAIAFAMAGLLSRAIGRSVNDMTGVMRKLAAGDNTVNIPGAGRKDEIGEMAVAVQDFKDAAIEKIRLEEEAEAQRRQIEADRLERERLKAIDDEQDRVAITALGEALTRLASGDLTHRINVEFAPRAVKLREDFNAAAAKLRDTLQAINGSTSGVRTGSDEIALAADDLSRRTEQQAASLEETAAALDQITATVRKTAAGAQDASGLVAETRRSAEESGRVVDRAVSAMGSIEKSSSEIGQIIGVIDEIAFQTNLLALNAGVEAARAGDAGKGFAVVASEVRALAQRSAEAAKEIKGLISTSSDQVKQGVDLVGQTGTALQQIVKQVADIDRLVSEIAASAKEQATGLHEVNAAVNQMDQMTQQNAAMVEESTAATQSLRGEAGELAGLVGQFRVGDGDIDNNPVHAAHNRLAQEMRAA